MSLCCFSEFSTDVPEEDTIWMEGLAAPKLIVHVPLSINCVLPDVWSHPGGHIREGVGRVMFALITNLDGPFNH